MANVGSLKSKAPKPAPPPPEAAGRMLEAEPAKPAVPSLLDLARQKQAEKAEMVAAPAEELAPKVDRRRGRPKRTEDVRGFAARVKPETYDRIQAIVERDRWKLGPLVDKMVQVYEAQRIRDALEIVGDRKPHESDDDLIRRAFRL